MSHVFSGMSVFPRHQYSLPSLLGGSVQAAHRLNTEFWMLSYMLLRTLHLVVHNCPAEDIQDCGVSLLESVTYSKFGCLYNLKAFGIITGAA